MGDFLVLSVLAVAVLLAFRSIRKDVKKGGCVGCSGNCSGCSKYRNVQ